MAYNTLTLLFDGPVATLTIQRPEVLNALNRNVLAELRAAVAEVSATPSCRCMVITGAGPKSFVAGADIAEMSAMTREEAVTFARDGQAAFDDLEALPIPVIAAVNGFALGGGCELVLACDVVYAAQNALFGQPEVKLGVIPGFGGTARLIRAIGRKSAMEWILGGDTYPAAEALRLGLVQKVLPADDLMPQAMELARKIASRAPLAVALAKRLVLGATDVCCRDALEAEAQAFSALFGTVDQKEGMEAFLKRRPPVFVGS
jgi:enoyl-CoA hydratase